MQILMLYNSVDQDLNERVISLLHQTNFEFINIHDLSTGERQVDKSLYICTEASLKDDEIYWIWREKCFDKAIPTLLVNDGRYVNKGALPYHIRHQKIYNVDQTKDSNQLLDDLLSFETIGNSSQTAQTLEEGESPFVSEIADPQTLKRAWQRIKKYMIEDSTYVNVHDFEIFEKQKEANIAIISDQINAGIFSLESLLCISSPKNPPENVAGSNDLSEMRELYYAKPKTALVLQAICDVIGPSLDGQLDVFNSGNHTKAKVAYGNRLKPDTAIGENIFIPYWEAYSQYKNDVQHYCNENPDTWFFRTDIRRFYPRINVKELLIDLGKDESVDQTIYRLLEQFLAIKAIDERGNRIDVPGLAAGIPLCHILANFYMRNLDREMSFESSGYFRYVDDIIYFSNNERDAQSLLGFLRDKLHELIIDTDNLTILNDKKTIGPHHVSENEVPFNTIIEELSPIMRGHYQLFDENKRKDIGRALHRILINVKDANIEIDEATSARYAKRVVKSLRELEYKPDDLPDIVVAFLKKSPLRSSSIKYLIEYLVDEFLDNPSLGHLRQILELGQTTSPDHASQYEYIQLAFLQYLNEILPNILMDHNELELSHLWSLMFSLGETKNIFIAGELMLLIAKIPEDELMRIQSNILNLLDNEVFSDVWYVLPRSVALFRVDRDLFISIAEHILTASDIRLSSARISWLEYFSDSEVSTYLMQLLREYQPNSGFELAYYLKIFIDQKNIIISLATRLRDLKLVSIDLFSKLISLYADQLSSEKVDNLYKVAGYRDASASQIKHYLSRDIDGKKYIFDYYEEVDLVDLADPRQFDYQCFYVERYGQLGLCEIISQNLLNRFSDFFVWERFLLQLEQKGIVTLFDVQMLNDVNTIVVIYGTRPEDRLLYHVLKEDRQQIHETSSFVRILSQINRFAIEIKNSNPHQDSIYYDYLVALHSYFITLSPMKQVRLLGLGASLPHSVYYHFAFGMVPENRERNLSTYSLFLSYLLYEMIVGESQHE